MEFTREDNVTIRKIILSQLLELERAPGHPDYIPNQIVAINCQPWKALILETLALIGSIEISRRDPEVVKDLSTTYHICITEAGRAGHGG